MCRPVPTYLEFTKHISRFANVEVIEWWHQWSANPTPSQKTVSRHTKKQRSTQTGPRTNAAADRQFHALTG